MKCHDCLIKDAVAVKQYGNVYIVLCEECADKHKSKKEEIKNEIDKTIS